MTTGEDDNNGKDNNSEDKGDEGKDNNDGGGYGNNGGGSVSAGGNQGNVRLVAVLCRALLVWSLHTVVIIQTCFEI